MYIIGIKYKEKMAFVQVQCVLYYNSVQITLHLFLRYTILKKRLNYEMALQLLKICC